MVARQISPTFRVIAGMVLGMMLAMMTITATILS